jgi:NitT/TauT family transport system ATP-binding protein
MIALAPMLQAEHLGIEYVIERTGERYQAIGDVTFSVPESGFMAVVGPSGCGKTSLLKAVAGLLPLNRGRLLIDGREVRGPGHNRGFVFQNDSLLPWRTVLGNALIGPEVSGAVGEKERSRTLGLLKLVGLGGFEQYYPRQLSGGMRQRVNLARALAIDPDILLMDEPFSALDAQTREIMQTELMRIWEEGRKTVLFVTHQIDEAVFLSDRVLVLARRPGRIRDIVEIALPRPRPLAVKRTAEFVAYVDRIWRLIEDDVRASVIEEHA